MIVLGCETKTVVLPNPDLRDHAKVERGQGFKAAMSGKLYGRAPSPRPKSMTWTFSSLTRLKAHEVIDFVASSAGKDVRLIDSSDVSWIVRITKPVLDVTTTGRGIGAGVQESCSLTIELEGEKL